MTLTEAAKRELLALGHGALGETIRYGPWSQLHAAGLIEGEQGHPLELTSKGKERCRTLRQYEQHLQELRDQRATDERARANLAL